MGLLAVRNPDPAIPAKAVANPSSAKAAIPWLLPRSARATGFPDFAGTTNAWRF
jgi:hypothetical protein